ncbi:MAG TPA: type IV toxin-antitoxin system AbiEi family antitoxin domain-containing protein [Solirubrobacterales bacterium]|nr:type IV toxin-antitoxin system AbiEi family antitoxin domain-containing protein [Solirubrobacterales bacterium]
MAKIARQQHGVVTSAQLREAGLSRDAVLGRARSGRLFSLHRGVYAVGHTALSFRSLSLAAVLACGNGAVLSHRSAAALWRLLKPAVGEIHVSIPTMTGRAERRGIRIHRRPTLSTQQVTRRHHIPVTNPALTIADIRSELEAPQWRRAVRQAEVLGLRTGLEASAPTRSELEDRFLALCRRHRLPPPEVNVRVGRWEVDFLWPVQRLVVETDGYRFHRGHAAFETDHVRDLDLRNAGLDVLHLTYDQVTNHSSQVASVVRRELEADRNAPC